MNYQKTNSPRTSLLRIIASGLFFSIPIASFLPLLAFASPSLCPELLCEASSGETGVKQVESPNILSQIRPIEPQ